MSLAGAEGDAVWWRDGEIQRVGSAAQLARQVPRGTPTYDLPGALVTPGLVDGHTHFGMWAESRRQVSLVGVATRAEAVRLVGAAIPVAGWVIGHGWDANQWADPPDRRVLDRVQAGPTFLESLDVHAAWVNSAALAAAGVTRDTPDPFGGRIVRDAAGEPTGLLLERAVELVRPHLPVAGTDQVRAAVREAVAEAGRLGLTAIHNVEGVGSWRAFVELAAAGELPLRVLFHPPVEALPQLVAEGWRSGQEAGAITLGGVKLFLDGSLGSRTAWMLEPFEGTRDRGMPITDGQLARQAVTMAAEAGIASTVHAIGDAAVRRALDLLEPLPRVRVPHRIEHFQCVDPADLGRAGRAGIPVSMQPAHLLTDIPLVDRHWGARGDRAYHFRSILEAGNTIVFGSDVPVASPDPREGIFAALDRTSADGSVTGWRAAERIGFDDAVRAYARTPALAAGAVRRGALAPGMAADLVAWDVDPAAEAGSGAAFRGARVRLTVVNGAVVCAP
ncbi:MAG TPA: amidohydrolase [Gemmatimonadales bacterium]|nr:amidohydrolase [Gemmatimonadales bacterium]